MTNTAGAIPGIIGVVCTGAILDQTGSWPLALFAPSIFFFVTGASRLWCLWIRSHNWVACCATSPHKVAAGRPDRLHILRVHATQGCKA